MALSECTKGGVSEKIYLIGRYFARANQQDDIDAIVGFAP